MGSPFATNCHPPAPPKRSPFVRSDHQAKGRIDPAISPGRHLLGDRRPQTGVDVDTARARLPERGRHHAASNLSRAVRGLVKRTTRLELATLSLGS
jgi:hypothetical protein